MDKGFASVKKGSPGFCLQVRKILKNRIMMILIEFILKLKTY
jgi:hypothetical protein